MDALKRRLDSLERLYGRRARTVSVFMPPDIAHSDREAAWRAAERQRRGLGPRDDLVAFKWAEVQP